MKDIIWNFTRENGTENSKMQTSYAYIQRKYLKGIKQNNLYLALKIGADIRRYN